MAARTWLVAAVLVLQASLWVPAGADAAPSLRYGIQDDAWLEFGPGTLESRVHTLDRLGVDVVRVFLDWSTIEQTRGVFSWQRGDALLGALRAGGITPLVTLYGTPGWANGGRPPSWAPTSGAAFAAFAGAAAERFPWVCDWIVWNEPNQRRWLQPTSATVYVRRLLNPAYLAIHDVIPGAKVAGGATAPRASNGGISPVAFIRSMGRLGARLDAYAHHPYPLSTVEAPWSRGCDRCSTLSISQLPTLLEETAAAFGPQTRVWLTESGYQTNPPDPTLGVAPSLAATYEAATLLRASSLPRVDVLVHYLYRDEPELGRFQSGVVTRSGVAKPARLALAVPLAQVSRSGASVVLWAQVRTADSAQRVVLQWRDGASWRRMTTATTTSAHGTVKLVTRAQVGARLRLLVSSTGETSQSLTVR